MMIRTNITYYEYFLVVFFIIIHVALLWELRGQRLGWDKKQPRGSIVVPFWGSYLESYKVTPKRNYYAASGKPLAWRASSRSLRAAGVELVGVWDGLGNEVAYVYK